MLILHKYNSKYAELFQNEKNKLHNTLNNICLIDHIGSTSIPEVDGKGVIDIMLVFNNETDIESAVSLLQNIGYYLSPDRIERNGRVFMSSTGAKDSGEGDIHLHLLTKLNNDYFQAIMFRDYLIAHQEARRAYSELKYEISKKVNGNRKEYTKLKYDFIKNIINLAKN